MTRARRTESPLTKRRGRLLTAVVAAEWLGLHPVTVRRWISRGWLGGIRVGSRWYTTRDALRALERLRVAS